MSFSKDFPRAIKAANWLLERFKEKLEWPSKELITLARANGICRCALFEGKQRLELPLIGSGNRFWRVPPDWPGLTRSPEEVVRKRTGPRGPHRKTCNKHWERLEKMLLAAGWTPPAEASVT